MSEPTRRQKQQLRRVQEERQQKLPPGVKLLRALAGHKSLVTSMAFDPLGQTLASGSEDKTVKLWGVGSGKLLRTLAGHESAVSSVVFDPQSGALVSGENGGALNLWETRSGKLLSASRAFWSHAHPNSIAFKPSGGELTIGCRDGTIRVWPSAKSPVPRQQQHHKTHVGSVAFNPTGQLLASGSGDGTVMVSDAASGKLLCTLEGHTGDVWAVAFSADGRLLVSSSDDGTIRFWSCETWETLAVLPQERINPEAWQRRGKRTMRFHVNPGFGFHPTLPLLATIGWEQPRSAHEQPRLIHLWELDFDMLLGQRVGATLTAITKKRGDWWVGWIEEVPGVNAQEKTKEELICSLREILCSKTLRSG